MVVELDHFSTQGKQTFIIAAVVVGIVLSHVTSILRVWAKLSGLGRLQSEDWFMLAALALSYSFVVCEFYGISMGLGKHIKVVSKHDLLHLNISIWVIQRFQPPAIFCIKTSIILLYVRIFSTPMFKKVAWGIWIYTLLWTIGAWLASTFECTPVSFFWDKSIPGGFCVDNALTVVGFTDGFLSFLGDLFILCMPLPMVWGLQMNRASKVVLTGVFLFGVFVVGTSIIRLVALFAIDKKDIPFTQVHAGVWTYLEVSIGITCGNLPLLRPLFRRFFDSVSDITRGSKLKGSNPTGNNSRMPPPHLVGTMRGDGFERMAGDLESIGESGSEIELQNNHKMEYKDGIKVKTDVQLSVQEMHDDGTKAQKLERETWDPLNKPSEATVAARRY